MCARFQNNLQKIKFILLFEVKINKSRWLFSLFLKIPNDNFSVMNFF